METLEATIYLRKPEVASTVADFLLERADVVGFTSSGTRPEERRAILSEWAPYFIEEVENSRRYPDIVQPSGPFTHYYFKLAEPISEKIRDLGLAWWDNDGLLGLEDPVFYAMQPKENGFRRLLGSVISHEGLVELQLGPEDMAALKRILPHWQKNREY